MDQDYNRLNENKQENLTNNIELPTLNNTNKENKNLVEENKTTTPNINNVEVKSQVVENQNSTEPISNDLPKIEKEISIGTIKKDKQKSPIAMLILFTTLIISIFFIPYITPYFTNLLALFGISSNTELYEGVKDPVEIPPVEEEPEEDNKTNNYDLNETTKIDFQKLEISNIKTTEEEGKYAIEYTIKNNGDTYDFRTNKVFFDLYDEANTYLGNILVNTETLPKNTTIKLTSYINEKIYRNATKMQILTRTKDDYPEITLKNNVLNCSLNGRNITYTFENNILKEVSDTLNYINTLDVTDYVNYSINYQNKISKINEIEGAYAAFVSTETGFTSNIKFDYTIVKDDMSVYDNIYYKNDTTAKEISYELTSLGYNCNE